MRIGVDVERLVEICVVVVAVVVGGVFILNVSAISIVPSMSEGMLSLTWIGDEA